MNVVCVPRVAARLPVTASRQSRSDLHREHPQCPWGWMTWPQASQVGSGLGVVGVANIATGAGLVAGVVASAPAATATPATATPATKMEATAPTMRFFTRTPITLGASVVQDNLVRLRPVRPPVPSSASSVRGTPPAALAAHPTRTGPAPRRPYNRHHGTPPDHRIGFSPLMLLPGRGRMIRGSDREAARARLERPGTARR
ncbi:MAG: hypothetical protein QOG46_360 [Pseudonocardiales bacterium]|nr:hypothetical protein [Pseudonocardiales bacterium]